MQRKLFHREPTSTSIWPVLFSMAALMLLLLPTLLLVMSPQKSTALSLSVAGLNDIPRLPTGPVESLTVKATSPGFEVIAIIRNTDVLAKEGDTQSVGEKVTNLDELQKYLRHLKEMDPKRTRIQIQPAATTLTEDVVLWMDVLRKDKQGELFPEIIISRETK